MKLPKFDYASYDDEADVLYLSVGEPRPCECDETEGGHVLRFDLETGELCGLTVIGLTRLL